MYRIIVLSTFLFFLSECCKAQKNALKLLPEGYLLSEKYHGDINNDGGEDCVLIIKGTDKNNVVNRFGKEVDRNRRGIMVLLNNEDKYDIVTKNYSCFYSENEDGGVYYAPQLSVEIIKGDLVIHFEHGRYGYWSYTFRFEDSEFYLIKYDATSTYGPITQYETSVNFVTMKKLVRENINEAAEGNDEIFKETEKTIKLNKRIRLSEIKDFEELDLSTY